VVPDAALGPYRRRIATQKAKAICKGCPVRAACLQMALDADIQYGIWGGLTELAELGPEWLTRKKQHTAPSHDARIGLAGSRFAAVGKGSRCRRRPHQHRGVDRQHERQGCRCHHCATGAWCAVRHPGRRREIQTAVSESRHRRRQPSAQDGQAPRVPIGGRRIPARR
jgi:hypothetical protein